MKPRFRKSHGPGTGVMGGGKTRDSRRGRSHAFFGLPIVAILIGGVSSLGGASSFAATPKVQQAASAHVSLAVSSASSPVAIGAIVTTNNAALAVPAIPASIKAAVRSINAHGGLDGHHVVFDYCNDQLNPTTAAQCANQMVADHVIATVGNFSLFEAAIVPILDKAGIPQIASEPLIQQQYTSPDSFLVDPGGYGYADSSMIAARNAGVRKIAIVYVSGAGLDAVISSAVNKAKSLGMHVTAQIPVSPLASDLDPTVQAVASSGAQAAYVVLTTGGSVAFIKSYGTQAAKYKVFLAAAQLSTGAIKETSAASPNMYGVKMVGAVVPFSSAKQYAREMAAEASAGDSDAAESQWDQNGLQAWMVMHLLVTVLKPLGGKPLTASAVTKEMDAARNLTTGIMPPWTPSKAGPAGIPRVSNPYMYLEVVKNGTLVLSQRKPINSFAR
jgi:ABC-type branched-subunit amino acid transport system substrate-binding protein